MMDEANLNLNKKLNKLKKYILDSRIQIVGIYLSSCLYLGLATSSPGSALLILQSNIHSSTAGLSWSVFSSRSLGFLVGNLFAGFLLDKYNSKGHLLISLSLILNALCVISVPFVPNVYIMSLVWLVWGFSGAVPDIFANILTIYLFERKKNDDQTLMDNNESKLESKSDIIEEEEESLTVEPFLHAVHFAWAIGAFLSPFLIGIWMKVEGQTNSNSDIVVPYFVIFFTSLPPALLLFFYETPHPKYVKASEVKPSIFAQIKQLTQREVIIIFLCGFFLFLYVGAESACGGLSYTYLTRRFPSVSESNASLVSSSFFAFLTIGRALAIPISMRFTPQLMLLSNIIGCFVSVGVVLVFSNNFTMTVIGICMFGLSNASSYATVLNLASNLMELRGSTGSLIVAGGSLEMFMPGLVGTLMGLGEDDEQSKKKNAIILWWWLLGVMVLLLGSYFGIISQNKKKVEAEEEKVKVTDIEGSVEEPLKTDAEEESL